MSILSSLNWNIFRLINISREAQRETRQTIKRISTSRETMLEKAILLLIVLSGFALTCICGHAPVFSAEAVSSETEKRAPADGQKQTAPRQGEKELPPEKLSITHHVVTIDGRSINYTATAGTVQMRDQSGTVRATLFFAAYTAEKQKGEPVRPVTFAFNGGPGAASLWLHLADWGPGVCFLRMRKEPCRRLTRWRPTSTCGSPLPT